MGKQIKVRAGEYLYTADQVALCRIEKPANFLGFWYIGTGHEKEHLKEKEEGDKAELIQRAKELKGEGKTEREIATELGIGKSTVNRYLNS